MHVVIEADYVSADYYVAASVLSGFYLATIWPPLYCGLKWPIKGLLIAALLGAVCWVPGPP